MAAVFDPVEGLSQESESSSQHRGYSSLGKKYRKGKIISQGYSKRERQDARREAARNFLLGIPLDKGNKSSSGNDNTVNNNNTEELESAIKEQVNKSDGGVLLSPNTFGLTDILPSSSVHPLQQVIVTQKNTTMSYSPRRSKRRKGSGVNKKLSYGQLLIDNSTHSLHNIRTYTLHPDNTRLAFTHNGHPIILSTVIPYKKLDKRYKPEISSSGIRIRSNSVSTQIELDGIDLSDTTQEISLGMHGLLDPIWINAVDSTDSGAFVPPIPARQVSVRRTSALLVHQTSFRESMTPPPETMTTKQYPWLFFRENHTPHHVITNYHPDCLDNREYFLGRHVTTLNLSGYRVSWLKYARESEMKKEINRQFTDMFPHVKITLTKLRSIKKEMIAIGSECGLDPVPLAHSHVYFEKLVMMGKVNKSSRKFLAGACLLLATKFASDAKRFDIKNLIEEITDKFRISLKEVLSYEFPTLVALQFSLLTPVDQVRIHYDRIKHYDIQ